MKLLTFKATNVHGHLDFNVNFFEDLNFLTGLNGTGKTTALNLMIALITPSFKHLIPTNFKYIELTLIQNNTTHIITSEKIDKKLYLSINDKKSFIDMQGLPVHDEEEDSLQFEFHDNSIIEEIQKIPTPMFLDLNRRFIKSSRDDRYNNKRKFIFDHNGHIEKYRYDEDEDLSLLEVKRQIKEMVSSINRIKLRLGEKLKKKILKDSFSLLTLSKTSDLKVPTSNELQDYKRAILTTLEQLDLLDNDETLYHDFFTSMDEIIKNLAQINMKEGVKPESKDMEYISKWIINQPQLERVIQLAKQIDKHQKDVESTEKTKENFLNSINRFYEQTDKKIIIKDNGKVEITIKSQAKDIKLLSSGERQLLIILSHLSLNRNLPKSSVFIIDEPELSLHLLWQEMFVDEILKAKPGLQIILATHSPAIINNKKNKHVPLNEVMNG